MRPNESVGNAYKEVVDVEAGSTPKRDAHADGAFAPIDMLYAPSIGALFRKESDVDVSTDALERSNNPFI